MCYPIAPLFRSKKAYTVGFARCGKGEVVLLASAWSLSNDGVGRGNNLRLVLNALSHRDPARKLTITFDEYHHGYGRRKGIMSLIDRWGRLGLLQLGVAFVLLILAVSRRFGRPIHLREGIRVRSEYLTSMSSLLRRANAVDAVRKSLDGKFISDVCRWLGLPPNSDIPVILEKARYQCPEKVADLEALLRSDSSTDEKSLLILQARRNQLRKELAEK